MQKQRIIESEEMVAMHCQMTRSDHRLGEERSADVLASGQYQQLKPYNQLVA